MNGNLAVKQETDSKGIIEQEIPAFLAILRTVKVLDIDTFKQAGDYCEQITDKEKKVHAYWDEDVERAHEAHKSLVAKRASFLDPLKTAKNWLKQQMKDWQTAEEHKRLEIERQAQEAARKLAEDQALAQAAALEKEGDKAAAEEVISRPVDVPAIVVQNTIPKGYGSFTRKTWSADVTDLMSLVKAVAAGQAPLMALSANTAFLNNQARAMKQALNYPGVKAVEK